MNFFWYSGVCLGQFIFFFCASDRTASAGVCRTRLCRDNKPFSVLDLGSRNYCPSHLSYCTVPLRRVSVAGYDD